MRIKGLIFLVFFCNTYVFSQWKSHYPETKEHKEENLKEKVKKNEVLFEKHFFTALKLKSLENYDEALKYFQKCIKINNKISTPFYESSIINKNIGNLSLASEQIKEALVIEPRNEWYLLTAAEIYFTAQNYNSAIKNYRKLINLNPNKESYYYQLSDTYIYNNNFQKAINVYNELEKITGIDKMVSIQKHKLYIQLKNKKEAIKELIKVLEKNPNDIEILEMLSELYLLNNEREKAFEVFKRIGIIKPENGRIHLTLADYYRESGEDEKSFEELKLAFKSSEAMKYNKNLSEEPEILKELNKSDYRLMAISFENYKDFYKNKDMKGYYDFFIKKYLSKN